jgi:hypothetical protein
MRKMWMCLFASVIVASSSFGFEEAIDFKALSEARGVSKVITDKKGNIKTVYVNGTAIISTALGATRGEEAARKKADLDARAQLRIWIKNSVQISESADGESITIIEGAEKDGDNGVNESGKAIEKTSSKFKSVSEGLVSGLRDAHIEQNGEKKLIVVIKKLEVSQLKSIKALEKELNSSLEKNETKKTDKKVENRSKTLDP